ncbi:unnamed protein product [Dovyalis caffra]|uniref:Uncharacterized protein n=1 Tax=Dovyalis caffra TaxID=77055 RepID=A0AAV1R0P4_9ROSI|nr:unnamed protein product [Dovyalis caffra]
MVDEDWTESIRGMVIGEAGGSRFSQGQEEDLSDILNRENLTESITVEGFMLVGQGSEGQGADVSVAGVEDLTDNFTRGASIGRFLELPEDVSALSIGRCHDARSLCDVSPFKHATSLKSVGMWECDGIECLASMSESSPDILERLESLYLETLKNFCVFITREGAATPPLQSNVAFAGLERLEDPPSSLPLNDHSQEPKELKSLEKVKIKLGRDADSLE